MDNYSRPLPVTSAQFRSSREVLRGRTTTSRATLTGRTSRTRTPRGSSTTTSWCRRSWWSRKSHIVKNTKTARARLLLSSSLTLHLFFLLQLQSFYLVQHADLVHGRRRMLRHEDDRGKTKEEIGYEFREKSDLFPLGKVVAGLWSWFFGSGTTVRETNGFNISTNGTGTNATPTNSTTPNGTRSTSTSPGETSTTVGGVANDNAAAVGSIRWASSGSPTSAGSANAGTSGFITTAGNMTRRRSKNDTIISPATSSTNITNAAVSGESTIRATNITNTTFNGTRTSMNGTTNWTNNCTSSTATVSAAPPPQDADHLSWVGAANQEVTGNNVTHEDHAHVEVILPTTNTTGSVTNQAVAGWTGPTGGATALNSDEKTVAQKTENERGGEERDDGGADEDDQDPPAHHVSDPLSQREDHVDSRQRITSTAAPTEHREEEVSGEPKSETTSAGTIFAKPVPNSTSSTAKIDFAITEGLERWDRETRSNLEEYKEKMHQHQTTRTFSTTVTTRTTNKHIFSDVLSSTAVDRRDPSPYRISKVSKHHDPTSSSQQDDEQAIYSFLELKGENHQHHNHQQLLAGTDEDFMANKKEGVAAPGTRTASSNFVEDTTTSTRRAGNSEFLEKSEGEMSPTPASSSSSTPVSSTVVDSTKPASTSTRKPEFNSQLRTDGAKIIPVTGSDGAAAATSSSTLLDQDEQSAARPRGVAVQEEKLVAGEQEEFDDTAALMSSERSGTATDEERTGDKKGSFDEEQKAEREAPASSAVSTRNELDSHEEKTREAPAAGPHDQQAQNPLQEHTTEFGSTAANAGTEHNYPKDVVEPAGAVAELQVTSEDEEFKSATQRQQEQQSSSTTGPLTGDLHPGKDDEEGFFEPDAGLRTTTDLVPGDLTPAMNEVHTEVVKRDSQGGPEEESSTVASKTTSSGSASGTPPGEEQVEEGHRDQEQLHETDGSSYLPVDRAASGKNLHAGDTPGAVAEERKITAMKIPEKSTEQSENAARRVSKMREATAVPGDENTGPAAKVTGNPSRSASRGKMTIPTNEDDTNNVAGISAAAGGSTGSGMHNYGATSAVETKKSLSVKPPIPRSPASHFRNLGRLIPPALRASGNGYVSLDGGSETAESGPARGTATSAAAAVGFLGSAWRMGARAAARALPGRALAAPRRGAGRTVAPTGGGGGPGDRGGPPDAVAEGDDDEETEISAEMFIPLLAYIQTALDTVKMQLDHSLQEEGDNADWQEKKVGDAARAEGKDGTSKRVDLERKSKSISTDESTCRELAFEFETTRDSSKSPTEWPTNRAEFSAKGVANIDAAIRVETIYMFAKDFVKPIAKSVDALINRLHETEVPLWQRLTQVGTASAVLAGGAAAVASGPVGSLHALAVGLRIIVGGAVAEVVTTKAMKKPSLLKPLADIFRKEAGYLTGKEALRKARTKSIPPRRRFRTAEQLRARMNYSGKEDTTDLPEFFVKVLVLPYVGKVVKLFLEGGVGLKSIGLLLLPQPDMKDASGNSISALAMRVFTHHDGKKESQPFLELLFQSTKSEVLEVALDKVVVDPIVSAGLPWFLWGMWDSFAVLLSADERGKERPAEQEQQKHVTYPPNPVLKPEAFPTEIQIPILQKILKVKIPSIVPIAKTIVRAVLRVTLRTLDPLSQEESLGVDIDKNFIPTPAAKEAAQLFAVSATEQQKVRLDPEWAAANLAPPATVNAFQNFLPGEEYDLGPDEDNVLSVPSPSGSSSSSSPGDGDGTSTPRTAVASPPGPMLAALLRAPPRLTANQPSGDAAVGEFVKKQNEIRSRVWGLARKEFQAKEFQAKIEGAASSATQLAWSPTVTKGKVAPTATPALNVKDTTTGTGQQKNARDQVQGPAYGEDDLPCDSHAASGGGSAGATSATTSAIVGGETGGSNLDARTSGIASGVTGVGENMLFLDSPPRKTSGSRTSSAQGQPAARAAPASAVARNSVGGHDEGLSVTLVQGKEVNGGDDNVNFLEPPSASAGSGEDANMLAAQASSTALSSGSSGTPKVKEEVEAQRRETHEVAQPLVKNVDHNQNKNVKTARTPTGIPHGDVHAPIAPHDDRSAAFPSTGDDGGNSVLQNKQEMMLIKDTSMIGNYPEQDSKRMSTEMATALPTTPSPSSPSTDDSSKNVDAADPSATGGGDQEPPVANRAATITSKNRADLRVAGQEQKDREQEKEMSQLVSFVPSGQGEQEHVLYQENYGESTTGHENYHRGSSKTEAVKITSAARQPEGAEVQMQYKSPGHENERDTTGEQEDHGQ
ncbi:unnamed protein product [Amoebophrya sp. A120]|nr:unnamed protein product [Amoebophrya sp. A120]|eukprot:GSA120T00007131001.1